MLRCMPLLYIHRKRHKEMMCSMQHHWACLKLHTRNINSDFENGTYLYWTSEDESEDWHTLGLDWLLLEGWSFITTNIHVLINKVGQSLIRAHCVRDTVLHMRNTKMDKTCYLPLKGSETSGWNNVEQDYFRNKITSVTIMALREQRV